MDLRLYYTKIREAEAAIAEEFPVVVSKAENGSQPGILSEVTRKIAARMFVEGHADPASPEQVDTFRKEQAAVIHAIRDAEETAQLRVAIMADDLLHSIQKNHARPEKG